MSELSYQQILLQQISIPLKLISSFKDYGLNETELVVILQLHRFLYEGNDFPTPEEFSTSLSIGEQECSHILRKLLQKGLLSINQFENEHHQYTEAYSLNPLWEKLFETKKNDQTNEMNEGTIFLLFEQEFGRPLSPFEIETINIWLDEDKISPSLIKAGLREAVLMGKLNFKYIDRILRNWKSNGIKTVNQARQVSQEYRGQKGTVPTQEEEKDTFVYYNWLKGEKE